MTETPRLTDDELATFALGFERLRGAGVNLQDEDHEVESMVAELRARRAQTCETCGFSRVDDNPYAYYCSTLVTNVPREVNSVPFGCSVHEPKAGAQ